MIVWIGVALLSASWLPGLGYYHSADGTVWAILVLLGSLCMLTFPGNLQSPSLRANAVSLLLILPALLVAPWPHRAAVLLISVGLAAQLATRAGRTRGPLQRVSNALLVAGGVLLLQSLALSLYAAVTARTHELPAPLPELVGWVARAMGVEAAVEGNAIAMHSMRQIHLLGATWELLLDPVTAGYLVSAVPLFCWICRSTGPRGRRSFATRLALLSLLLAIWLPIRAGWMMVLYMEGVLRTDYDNPLTAMRLFWSTGWHLVMLCGPVLICWKAAVGAATPDRRDAQARSPAVAPLRRGLPMAAAALGVAGVTVGIFWDPVGTRQSGRVLVEEYNPAPDRIWEPTSRPYDTEWYGPESGYNYYCIYDYCSRFYAMSRQTEQLTAEALQACDVLIIKVPTRSYTAREIRLVEGFVRRGGGLLLIGEHTNVYKTSDYLNPLARRFGFRFRHDCVFGIDSVFEQLYRRPFVPHPIVQYFSEMDFATSCSIAPGGSPGRAAIRDLGLKNLLADYHADNFYPSPDNQAEMRYGSFVQLWATRHGRGRVVAFSDSTIFSNFSVFDRGKSELMLGMIEWLNHRSAIGNPRPILVTSGCLLLVGGVFALRRGAANAPLVLAAGLLAWSLSVGGVRWYHQLKMPPPRAVRDYVQVNIDRTICRSPLSKNGFVDGTEQGFGIFERWMLRLGYFTSRRAAPDLFRGDLVVFLHPERIPGRRFQEQLVEYVRQGGKVLVVESAREGSSAESLLEPFGLRLAPKQPLQGTLRAEALPAVQVSRAVGVVGGEPIAWLGDTVVAATVSAGEGSVTVIGFGSRFTDANMGGTGDVVPDLELRQVFDLQFGLLRAMMLGP